MRQLLAFLALFFLLSGCALPWEQGKSPSITPGVKPPPAWQPSANESGPNAANATNVTQAPAQNQTLPPPANETAPPPAEPEKPRTVPRNVSDKIYEGEFDLQPQKAAPLRIYVIDAGQADSVLIAKGEFAMLIDDGNGEAVQPFLQKLGIGRLEIVVATKDSPDAISGIYGLMDAAEVKEFWENGVTRKSQEYSALLQKAAILKAAVKRPEAGEGMNFSGLEILVLNPQRERLGGNPDTDAIVLLVKNGNFCMLLANPTVQERENAIIGAAGSQSLRCGVMTYFKHGEGRPNPSLLAEHVAPKDVIISVGPNSEGLPSNTTLTRLAEINRAKVWRTDIDGTILITNYGYVSYDITRWK